LLVAVYIRRTTNLFLRNTQFCIALQFNGRQCLHIFIAQRYTIFRFLLLPLHVWIAVGSWQIIIIIMFPSPFHYFGNTITWLQPVGNFLFLNGIFKYQLFFILLKINQLWIFSTQFWKVYISFPIIERSNNPLSCVLIKFRLSNNLLYLILVQ